MSGGWTSVSGPETRPKTERERLTEPVLEGKRLEGEKSRHLPLFGVQDVPRSVPNTPTMPKTHLYFSVLVTRPSGPHINSGKETPKNASG